MFIQVHLTDWIANPVMDGSGDEFWEPYNCPCKETWEANGFPVWDSTVTFYQGNYVVEWPAGSGDLYISEAGGITSAGEPKVLMDTGFHVKEMM